ncbi:MAG: metallophosphoesterase [Asgard group archaeon]|nr:metallophosphoesterase [Asgard group archaeon]
MSLSRYSITPSIQIIDASPILYLEDVNSLIIADLHLGYEAIMLEDGTYSPYNQTEELIEIVIKYINELEPEKLILNGDIKHSFHEPTKIENRDVKNFLNSVAQHVKELHIIRGNHDVYLNWVVRDIKNAIYHEIDYNLGQYYFTHGDRNLPETLLKGIKYIIIAHEHPIFSARVNGLQKIKSPTYLMGPLKYKKAKLIVTPAFSSYSTGTPIHPKSKEFLLSPILREEVILEDFELFVLSDDKDVLHFPSFKLWS